jgi:hypothetical protein
VRPCRSSDGPVEQSGGELVAVCGRELAEHAAQVVLHHRLSRATTVDDSAPTGGTRRGR